MPAGELEINLYDAYEKWGVSLEDGMLSELMAYPSSKEWITNESSLEPGTRYASPVPKVAQREINIVVHITAPNHNVFLQRRDDFFNQVLLQGVVNIRTRWQRTTLYRCRYISCSQFSQIDRRIAKFSLRLVEANPLDREYKDAQGNVYNTDADLVIGAHAPTNS